MIYFDIETGPDANALEFADVPQAPANYKDPAKIAEYVAEKRKEQVKSAALSPLTGKVLVIGLLVDDSREPRYFEGNEADLLADFWLYYNETRQRGESQEWVGFNCKSFDWPFLAKRSLKHGIRPPRLFTDRQYMLDHLRDLRDAWQMGDRQAPGSLGVICKWLGLGEKSGDGGQFAELYAADRQKAMAYLCNDLLLTRKLAKVLL